MISFIKLSANEGKTWGYVYAERAEATDQTLTVFNRQYPRLHWKGPGVWQVSSWSPWGKDLVRYPASRFHLLATPICRPDWFEAIAPEPLITRPEWVPEPIFSAGLRQTATFIMGTLAFGRLYRAECTRTLVGKLIAIENLAPVLHTPDFLHGEDKLIADWATKRPAAHQRASESARTVVDSLDGHVAPEVAAFRALVRMATMRKIDASLHGAEEFAPTPCLALEASLDVPIPRGKLAFGLVANQSWTTSVDLPAVPPEFESIAIVSAAEACFAPGVHAGIANSHIFWAEAMHCHDWRHHIHACEVGHQLPALIGAGHFGPDPLKTPAPRGFKLQWDRDWLDSQNMCALDVAQSGLPIYLADQTERILKRLPAGVPLATPVQAATWAVKRILAKVGHHAATQAQAEPNSAAREAA